MDASHLLSLLRNSKSTVGTPTNQPATSPSLANGGKDDLARLFSAFTNPHATSPPPSTASPTNPAVRSQTALSGEVSSRQIPVGSPRQNDTTANDVSTYGSPNVYGKRGGTLLDRRTIIIEGTESSSTARGAPSALGSTSYQSSSLDSARMPPSASVTRSTASDARSLLDSIMNPKTLPSSASSTSQPLISPPAGRQITAESSEARETLESTRISTAARLARAQSAIAVKDEIPKGAAAQLLAADRKREEAKVNLEEELARRESSVPQSEFTFTSPVPSITAAVKTDGPISTLDPAMKSGISLYKSPVNEDKLVIDITREYEESLFKGPIETLPITLLKHEVKWQSGNRVAAWSKGLCYATKSGKIRIIDRDTGARIMLNGHTGPILDLAVSPLCSALPGGQATRIVISAGSDGRVIFWRILNEFTAETTTFEEMYEVVKAPAKVPALLVRFSPRFLQDSSIAIARADGTVAEYLLEELSGRIPKWSNQRQIVREGASIVDVCYSPDGSAIATLFSDGYHTVKSTRSISGTPLSLSFSPLSESSSASQISFLSALGSPPAAFVISYNNGTTFRISSLRSTNLVGTRAILLKSNPELAIEEGSFGHLHFDQLTSTLFISNSIRGSLFALHVNFDAINFAPLPKGENDARNISKLSRSSTEVEIPRIDHLTELKTPEAIINFYLDDSRRESNGEESRLAALCVHPKGIHMIMFNHTGAIPVGDERDLEEEKKIEMRRESGAFRRPSLQDAIAVVHEVVIKVEEAIEEVATPALVSTLATEVLVEPVETVEVSEEPAQSIIAEPSQTDSANAPPPAIVPAESASDAAPVTSPTASNQIAAAIKSMKAKNTDKFIKLESTPSSPHASAITSAWAAGGSTSNGNGKKGAAKVESTELVLKELKKLEDTLPAKIAASVSAQLEQQTERFDEQRRLDQLAEVARQEEILRLVSTTLTNNTSTMVEKTIREQIKSHVIPSISALVNLALKDQIKQGFSDALTNSIPKELESLLSQPNTIAHLSDSITQNVIPSIQHDLADRIAGSVIPTLNASISTAVDSVMLRLGNQVMAVVQQQISALESTAAAVNGMRDEMKGMKERILQLEKLVSEKAEPSLTLFTDAPPTAPVLLPPTTQTSPKSTRRQPAMSAKVAPESTPSMVQPPPDAPPPLAPAPRPITPFDQYEEMFTNALQPSHESEAFLSLIHLIKSSPASRLDAVFPDSPSRPRTSSAVVLSLAFRLAQVVESGEGKLSDDERRQLAWIRRCLSAMDGKDLDTAAYSPRILENVIRSLANRRAKLDNINDRRGRDEVGIIEKYSRSRLALFE